jgi:outer membrane receptor for ferric coprogen and ferric-rhodotorulic acid
MKKKQNKLISTIISSLTIGALQSSVNLLMAEEVNSATSDLYETVVKFPGISVFGETENDPTQYLQKKATSTSRIPLTIKESPMTVTVVSKRIYLTL